MKRNKSVSPEPSKAQTVHPDVKRPKLVQGTNEIEYRGLMDLSDDVILQIFNYVSAVDLMSLYLYVLFEKLK